MIKRILIEKQRPYIQPLFFFIINTYISSEYVRIKTNTSHSGADSSSILPTYRLCQPIQCQYDPTAKGDRQQAGDDSHQIIRYIKGNQYDTGRNN